MIDDEQFANALAAHPDLAGRFYGVMAAIEALSSKLDQLQGLEYEDQLVGALNAMIRCWLAFGDVMDTAGLKPGRDDVRAEILAMRPSKSSSDFALGHGRAIRTAAAYKAGVRLNASGANDTPMQAALLVAAVLEGLSGDGAVDTIQKSIQRFRRKVRGTSVFRLDPDSMTYERFEAENVQLAGLPRKRGRPKKRVST